MSANLDLVRSIYAPWGRCAVKTEQGKPVPLRSVCRKSDAPLGPGRNNAVRSSQPLSLLSDRNIKFRL
jgi:hypothetical protein